MHNMNDDIGSNSIKSGTQSQNNEENNDELSASAEAALNARHYDALINEKKKELQEILEANQFMKQQIDLFAAFLWRHQQIGTNKSASNLSRNDSIIKSSNNDSSTDNIDNNENENENDETASVGSKPNGNKEFEDGIEMTVDEYSNLENKLSVDSRLKMGVTEKYLIKQEISKLINKSEKDVSTLKAVLEECHARMAETKKDAYDFKREIVVSSQTSSKAHASKENFMLKENHDSGSNGLSFTNIKMNNKINAEKVKKFINEKLKSKHLMYKKYQTKNSQLQIQISKLHDQLNISDSNDDSNIDSTNNNNSNNSNDKKDGSGDSYHTIDLEQLKIQNAQYNSTIIERNKELLKLKMNTGKTVQLLNNLKHRLNNEMKKQNHLTHNINDRELLINKLKNELTHVSNELNQQNKSYLTTKQKLANVDVPQVIEYVKQKAEQYTMTQTLQKWERKVQIATLSAKQAKVAINQQ